MDLFTKKYSHLFDSNGILPVICLKSMSETETFIEAIRETPIRCVEITLRHQFAKEAIKAIKSNLPGMTIGAGTVKNISLLKEAASYGADFCVAPGFTAELLDEAHKDNMPFLPGASTPVEFMKLSSYGYKTIKFFPAECMGGTKALKLYEGAFSELSFLPTGGISTLNYCDYCQCKNVIACGGSFMISSSMLQIGDAKGSLNNQH